MSERTYLSGRTIRLTAVGIGTLLSAGGLGAAIAKRSVLLAILLGFLLLLETADLVREFRGLLALYTATNHQGVAESNTKGVPESKEYNPRWFGRRDN